MGWILILIISAKLAEYNLPIAQTGAKFRAKARARRSAKTVRRRKIRLLVNFHENFSGIFRQAGKAGGFRCPIRFFFSIKSAALGQFV